MSRIGMPAMAIGISVLLCGCASGRDAWWGQDKLAHLAVSTTISGAATYAALEAGHERGRATRTGVGVVLVIGAAKEGRDQLQKNNYWSWKDMAWNLAGGLLGAGIAQALSQPED